MNNQFEVRYTVTKERYLKQAENPIKANRLSIVWIILMGVSLYYSYDALVGGYWLFCGFYLLLALFSAFQAFLRVRFFLLRAYKKAAKRQGCDQWVCSIRLGDEISVKNGNTLVTYHWEDIEKYRDQEDAVVLLFDDKSSLRLAKEEFVAGDADQFITFLRKEHPDIQQTN